MKKCWETGMEKQVFCGQMEMDGRCHGIEKDGKE